MGAVTTTPAVLGKSAVADEAAARRREWIGVEWDAVDGWIKWIPFLRCDVVIGACKGYSVLG